MSGGRIDSARVRRHFSRHAGEYDHHAQVQPRVVARLVAALAELGELPAGPVLDVGAGTGALLAEIERCWPGRPLVACDLAHNMSRVLRARLPAALACGGDARALPFATAGFGVVVSASVFQWLDELAPAFAEVARVLRPGGVLACAFFGKGTLAELQASWRLAGCECGRQVSLQHFHDAAAVQRALDPAHWRQPQLWHETEVDWYPGAAAVLRGLKRIGAQGGLRRRDAGLAPRRLVQRALELYAAHYGGPQGVPASYGIHYLLARRR